MRLRAPGRSARSRPAPLLPTPLIPTPLLPASRRPAPLAPTSILPALLLGALLAALPATPRPVSAQAGSPATVPTPESHLGFRVGADRKLADWGQISDYMAAVARTSDRVRVDTLGPSTLGRPFLLVTVSDPENLARLDRLREIQTLLADPRRLEDPVRRDSLLDEGRAVVLLTAAIHSTEVATHQMPLRLVYELATARDSATRRILREVVLLLVPSVNPDGVDLAVDWYRASVDMPWEGLSPPYLYHHYTGHDNNRDWYALTQQETRLVVQEVYARWHPQVVHDVHQMGAYGARYFVPPWIDPVDPNVDPALVAAGTDLGSAVAARLVGRGRSGVVVNAIYDAWSPSRAYAHYHGAVRILSETASARMATPLRVRPEEMEGGRGYHPLERSWNHPDPWRGGTWRLGDAVTYMLEGARALLDAVARERDTWMAMSTAVAERAVRGRDRWPSAWVIPAGQEDRRGYPELLRILRTGGVEVVRAREAFRAGGRSFGAGSLVVDMHQPYAAFAQTLLERQAYPEIRACEAEACPFREPYGVTAHTLPLLLGVEAVAVGGRVRAPADAVIEPPAPDTVVPGLTDARGIRVGLYQPWVPSMDEGWTRWLFDRYRVPYRTLHDGDIRQGGLERDFTALVLPSSPPEVFREGRPRDSAPRRFTGGLGPEGATAIRDFVEGGGTLVALNAASSYAIDVLDLPVRDVLRGADRSEFYAPGALVRLLVDADDPLAAGVASEPAGWIEGGLAFESRAGPEGPVRTVARYADDGVLLSGWLRGGERIAGRGAMVEVRVGEGRAVLYGFRPQYRGHSVATFPLFFNAFRRRSAGSPPSGSVPPGSDRSTYAAPAGSAPPGCRSAGPGP